MGCFGFQIWKQMVTSNFMHKYNEICCFSCTLMLNLSNSTLSWERIVHEMARGHILYPPNLPGKRSKLRPHLCQAPPMIVSLRHTGHRGSPRTPNLWTNWKNICKILQVQVPNDNWLKTFAETEQTWTHGNTLKSILNFDSTQILMRNDVCTSQEPSEWNPIATRWFHYGAAFFKPSFDEFCNQPFQAFCIYFDAKCQLANVNMCVRSLYPSIRLSRYSF